MIRYVAIYLLFAISAGLSAAADLATLRSAYDKNLQRIIQAHDKKKSDLDGKYTESLERMLKEVQKRGDLDKTVMLTEELARFKKERAMTPDLSALPELKRLQASYSRRESSLKSEQLKTISALITQYNEVLERAEKKRVSENHLDKALEIRKERERVRDSAWARAVKKGTPAVTALPPDDARPRGGIYPEETFTFRGSHYFRLPLRHNLPDAQDICKELGGHVLAIDNRFEHEFLKNLAAEKDWPTLILDLNDEKNEGTWVSWRGVRPAYLNWHKGEPNGGDQDNAVCINLDGKNLDMTDIPTKRHGITVCEWDPGKKPDLEGIEALGLCEIACSSSGGVSVQTLEPGTARLGGGFKPTFSHVSPDLRGAQFLRVGWQSRPMHQITVTKPGYLYVFKIGEWADKDKLPLEHIPDALRGSYHKSGAYRVKVTKDQSLTLRGYETGAVAARIEMEK